MRPEPSNDWSRIARASVRFMIAPSTPRKCLKLKPVDQTGQNRALRTFGNRTVREVSCPVKEKAAHPGGQVCHRWAALGPLGAWRGRLATLSLGGQRASRSSPTRPGQKKGRHWGRPSLSFARSRWCGAGAAGRLEFGAGQAYAARSGWQAAEHFSPPAVSVQ